MKKYNLIIYLKAMGIERKLTITAIIIDGDYVEVADYDTGKTLFGNRNNVIIKDLKEMEEY